jgi:hypothetical protein
MSRSFVPLCIVGFGAFACVAATGVSADRQQAADTKQSSADDAAAAARLTRGKKLVLKDGNFQLGGKD